MDIMVDNPVVTYAAPASVRAAASVILFLVTVERPSRFHRLASDEAWLFHGGAPLTLTVLQPDGGTGVVNGFDVQRQPQAVRRSIGLAGQYAAVDENRTRDAGKRSRGSGESSPRGQNNGYRRSNYDS